MVNLRSKEIDKTKWIKMTVIEIANKSIGEVRTLANKLEGLMAKSHTFWLDKIPKKGSIIKVNTIYYYIVDEYAYIKFNTETGGFIGYFCNVDEYDEKGNFVGTDKKFIYQYELIEEVVLDVDWFFSKLRSQQ